MSGPDDPSRTYVQFGTHTTIEPRFGTCATNSSGAIPVAPREPSWFSSTIGAVHGGPGPVQRRRDLKIDEGEGDCAGWMWIWVPECEALTRPWRPASDDLSNRFGEGRGSERQPTFLCLQNGP